MVAFIEKYNRSISITLWTFFVIALVSYSVSSFFPGSFLWGINHLAFLELHERVIIILLVIFVGLPVISSWYLDALERQVHLRSPYRSTFFILPVLVGIIVTFLCYHYRIMTDMYGDSRTLIQLLSMQKFSILDVLKPADREPLTRFIHQFTAEVLNIQVKSVYEIISSVCGGLFIGMVLFFIHHLTDSKLWKTMVVVILVTAGTNQLFFGHVEDYTLIYLWMILFFMLSWMFFEGKRVIGWMAVTFLIGTRLHLEMLLLLPALTYAILYYFQQKYPKVEKWLRPQKIILAICITMIGATLVYFFYFGAYRYIRADQYEIIKRIFLPMYNCRQPPFVYSLFSLNHISDCIQQILLTVSPAALFVIGIGFIFKRRVKWLEPRIIFSLLGVFYFLIFNFTMYPMLTMPRDWDLFSLAAAPIIFLAIALSQQLFTRLFEPSDHKMIVGMAAALGLFSFTFFYVNSSSESASRRLEGIGKWVFKSHHASSSYMMNVSAKMVDNLDEQIKRREGAIRDLLPYASDPDHEIGFLYYKLGVVCYTNRQFDKAVENIQKSVEQDPDNASAIKSLAMIALQIWDFDEACRMISFYNKNINYPKIVDPRGNEIEGYCNQMKNLVSSNVDSSIIQRKLDYIFQLTK